jgi:hypothetical protein
MKSFQFKTVLAGAFLLIFGLGLMSLTSSRQTPWVIDAKYKAMKNPVKADATSIAAGKELTIRIVPHATERSVWAMV